MTTPRSFRAHVALTAQREAPPMWSGAYESVGEFFAVALAAEGAQRFEPVPGNEWVRPGSRARSRTGIWMPRLPARGSISRWLCTSKAT